MREHKENSHKGDKLSLEAEQNQSGHTLKSRLYASGLKRGGGGSRKTGEPPKKKKKISQKKLDPLVTSKTPKEHPLKGIKNQNNENDPAVGVLHFRSGSKANQTKSLPQLSNEAKESTTKNPLWFIDRLKKSPNSKEFVYMRMKNTEDSLDYNPYDLEIIPHSKINPDDYFTMSSTGVTHFINSDAEFTPLGDWEKEYRIFSKIIEIPFFKQYPYWKTFYNWRKHIHRSKLHNASKNIVHNLLILDTKLQIPIIETRKLCQDIMDLELYKEIKDSTLNLEEYENIQYERQTSAYHNLQQIYDSIKKIARRACSESMESAGFGQDPYQNMTGSIGNDMISNSNIGKTSDGVNLDESFGMSYTELSKKKSICKKLLSYIRLLDFFIYYSLYDLALNSVRLLFKNLSQAKIESKDDDAIPIEDEGSIEESVISSLDQKSGSTLFLIDIILNDQPNLEITPNWTQFNSSIRTIIEKITQVVGSVNNLITEDEFKEYTEPLARDKAEEFINTGGPDVTDLMGKEPQYSTVVYNIQRELESGFTTVEDYVEKFEPFIDMVVENSKVTRESLLERTSLEFFRDCVKKYKDEQEQIQSIEESVDLGIFHVNCERMKEAFLPSPTRCLNIIHEVLPKIAKNKTKVLKDEITRAVAHISSEPKTPEEFCEWLDFMQETNSKIEGYEEEYEYLDELYKFMKKEEIELNIEDEEEFTISTVSTMENLRSTITMNEDAKDGLMMSFSEEVANRFTEIEKDLKATQRKSRESLISDEDQDPQTVISFLEVLDEEINEIKDRIKTYNDYQNKFEAEISSVHILDEVSLEVRNKLKLWKSIQEWQNLSTQWLRTKFSQLQAEDMEEQVSSFSKTAFQMVKALSDNPLSHKLKAMVEKYKSVMPAVLELKNPALQDHHMKTLESLLDLELYTEEETTFGALFELDISNKSEQISEISQTASAEASLEQLLKKVSDKWAKEEFVLLQHKDSRGMFILGPVEDIVADIEDSQITISTILGSKYVANIKQRVEQWDKDLRLMSETLDEWIKVQQKWLYLENVFTSPDLNQQLPNEGKLFSSVDKVFKEIMKMTSENPNVHRCLRASGVLDKLQSCNSKLEKIEKRLDEYLEKKRDAFPRFYFLSNDDLLEILSQSKNPQAVQPHLMKIFENIKTLQFSSENPNYVAEMHSAEGEKVPLSKTVKVRPKPEVWLLDIESEMKETIKKLIKTAVQDYPKHPRLDWIKRHAAQIVLTVSQIFWCQSVTECLDSPNPKKRLEEFLQYSIDQLSELASMTRGKLDKLTRKMMSTLITIDVHARDIIENLIEEGISSPTDFGWYRQLRYYWEDNDCIVRQSNSRFVYGYEYLGCLSRLVITPLTDRVYMTLTGALHLSLGGAPQGPAGTGKTETVKDLGKAMAFQCVVYNCSEGITAKMMATFFSGLVQTGAWCCFDEFNRIDIEVLSVIASQIMKIREALLSKASSFYFVDREISIRPTCGFFITMNPGYAGRTELPDNLKALFRPVAVMIPDYAMIAEVILFSEGFVDAKSLSRKMVQLYKLSSEQLSSQDHYDFGMRAIKSVLVMAGSLKRSNPELHEDVTLIRAMRDSNLPKFVSHDLPLFKGILSDLFPDAEVPDQDFGNLEQTVKQVLIENHYQLVDSQIYKIIQLFDTLAVRHGVMLVGPTGGGKTVCREILAKSLSLLSEQNPDVEEYNKIKEYIINPKSIAYSELYGSYNSLQQWNDGILALIARKAVKDNTNDSKWIIFDGPVDTLWIESMNSVLDDSKLLCLDNGERIKLNDTIAMLFETQDLAVASPATVSRCGMVYVDEETITWEPVAKTWLEKDMSQYLTNSEVRDYVWSLFEEYLQSGIKFVQNECEQDMQSVPLNMVDSLCSLYQAFMLENNLKFETIQDTYKTYLTNIFFFAYIWSLGANVSTNSRVKFDQYLRTNVTSLSLPSNGTVYDYFLDESAARFIPWADIVPNFKYSSKLPFFRMVVPTVDTVRYSYLLKQLLQVGKPVLFTGETGVGKTVIVSNTLEEKRETLNLEHVTVQFSAQTSSSRTQSMIESKLHQTKKNLYGAPNGKKMIVFVDDLNMPKLEEYGASPPIELLRQLIGQKGFYHREEYFWINIKDVTIVAACGPPGGGKNFVTPRLLRYFQMFNLPDLSDNSKKKIFNSIFSGFLESFSSDIKMLCNPVVNASIEMYNRVCEELRPTPDKSHYTFNLRDLSGLFQGMLQARPSCINTTETFMRLWIHESMRSFYDRLISDEDRQYYTKLISDLAKRYFKTSKTHEDLFETDPIVFGDFGSIGVPQEERKYEEFQDFSKIPEILDDYLSGFSENMKLVFFSDATKHVARIVRIIRQPRGNALLVGVGGSGKKSLTKLAAFIAEYQCIEIELKKVYGLADFREDLKRMFQIAGEEGHPVVFLFSDNQIIEESFLEDINNILNSGEVPNLFEPDEKEQIINDVRDSARAEGLPEHRDSVYGHFIERVRDNLHIVLCMSPVGEAFRTRLRMFPSLVNCCTIDWFDEWPKEALLAVARNYLSSTNLEKDTKEKFAQCCVYVHSTITDMADQFFHEMRRHVYITPTTYLKFLELFIHMLYETKQSHENEKDKYGTGLSKLKETNEKVSNMESELKEYKPQVEQKKKEVAELVEQLSEDKKQANEVKKVISAEEETVNEKTEEARKIQESAQADLDQALPALREAYQSLDALSSSDISEIKSYSTPSDKLLMVLRAVLTLRGEKDLSWDNAKSAMNDPQQFLRSCKKVDKDNIPQSIINKLKKYTENPEFTPKSVGSTSSAAKSLCLWVLAMEKYHYVAKTVEPKRQKVAEAEEQLKSMNAKLSEKRENLKEVEDQLATLTKKYQKNEQEKQELEETMKTIEKRLDRARQLTSALADETVRWDKSVTELDSKFPDIAGNAFLSASIVSYLGPFSSNYREQALEYWKEKIEEMSIPFSQDFSLDTTLSEPVEIREWNISGLPTDKLSVDNAIIASRSSRWPLMIDPQGQANSWIKSIQAKNGLKVINLSDPNYLRSVENAIRLGIPLLIEDIGENIDPALDPLLRKSVPHTSFEKRQIVKIGDTEIELDPKFRLYLTTKLQNPHYLPEVCIKVNLINFTVTSKGLEDQLLGDVVSHELPELEQKKDQLVVSLAGDKKTLAELEDKILNSLRSADKNILDDEKIIQVLNKSKQTANMVEERVEASEKTQVELNERREDYRSVANRGSILYFVIADMVNLDPMYQNSLDYFKKLFSLCIENAPQSDSLNTRLEILITEITETVYSNICRGLFEKDKLIFSFLMCCQILRNKGSISETEWNFFVRAPAVKEYPNKPDIEWINENTWISLYSAEMNIDNLSGLTDGIKENPDSWCNFIDSAEPLKEKLPSNSSIDWNSRLSYFQKLILIRCLKEDKIYYAIFEYITKELGSKFIESPPLDLEKALNDSKPSTPIIFILSQGADPTASILRFAEEKGRKSKMKFISLGQGQGPAAKSLIENGRKTGDWVLLQNCHLAQSFMPELEQIVQNFNSKNYTLHQDFRLWLTSMPAAHFPIPILQNGIKLTTEPPKGIKANLQRSFGEIKDTTFTTFDDVQEKFPEATKSYAFKKLLFGLCFFHAIIQERKKFGALGWNKKYEFNESDLEVSQMWLEIFLKEQDKLPWDSLRYVIGEINYGGRVTDPWDRRLLLTILNNYFSPEILQEGYKFSTSGIYKAPDGDTLHAVRDYISSLPYNDDPEVFGMHENASITFQSQETKRLMSTILSIQPRTVSSSGGKTSEDLVRDITQEITEQLPELLDRSTAHPKTFEKTEDGLVHSLGTVLDHEIGKYNRLLSTIRSSLEELKKALAGLIVLSEELDGVYGSLLNNQVPKMWEAVAYPSLKPLRSWIKDLCQRVDFMRHWLQNGSPACFWMSGFFFPQGFITGVLQTHARKYKIPIDSLSFKFEVLNKFEDEITQSPEDGVYVSGLFLDGARWDLENGVLTESFENELYPRVPVIHFLPQQDYQKPSDRYSCPLYKTSIRKGVLSSMGQSTNFIIAVDLPTPSKRPEHWTLRGTALLCQLDD
eukprot:gb/GECH01008685.1/.p1 GENE.gb/GECH01008685.1/~~gb/GECH01008685.1/.p1  ORF type:complete len:4033 (+),score=845.30 gb/GECH01008685.1/:1-12099(+)